MLYFLIKSIVLVLALASGCKSEELTEENIKHEPALEPFLSVKPELFRYSRSLKGSPVAHYEQQHQVELDQQARQQQQVDVGNQNEAQQHVSIANTLPTFGGNAKTSTPVVNSPVVAVDDDQQQHQQQRTSSSSASANKNSASSKTITTTSTITTTNKLNQEQPQVAQVKEIHVHTVPFSQAVHYANYVVVPTSSGASKATHLEESSSSSSSQKSSTSTTSETEQIALAPPPAVVVNPSPVVAPDCVLHRLVVERPATSQLVVQVAPEVQVSHSSSTSSSHSSKVVQAQPETTFYSVRRVFSPVVSARVVAVPPVVVAPAANDGHLREEHHRSESRSSREESHGLGHSMSSSSSSSSSSTRTSKSTTTTTSQTGALLAPPPMPVPTVTTYVRTHLTPVVSVKSSPLVKIDSGRTNDVSVNVDHHQSGPNYNYGYSIKQHSSEPGTKGVVVGDRVVYLRK